MTNNPQGGTIPKRCAIGKCVPKYEKNLGNTYCEVCFHWLYQGTPPEPVAEASSPTHPENCVCIAKVEEVARLCVELAKKKFEEAMEDEGHAPIVFDIRESDFAAILRPFTLVSQPPDFTTLNETIEALNDAAEMLREKHEPTGFDISVALIVEQSVQKLKSVDAAPVTSVSHEPERVKDLELAAELLEIMYDKWENGDPSFSEAGDSLGQAFQLGDSEDKIIDVLNRLFPRSAATPEIAPGEQVHCQECHKPIHFDGGYNQWFHDEDGTPTYPKCMNAGIAPKGDK